jgi:hypothetical protein
VTPYRERQQNNDYAAKPRPASESDGPARKDLVALAEQHELPSYGTRAQLLERLTAAGILTDTVVSS